MRLYISILEKGYGSFTIDVEMAVFSGSAKRGQSSKGIVFYRRRWEWSHIL